MSKIRVLLLLLTCAAMVHADPAVKKSPFLGDYSSFKKDKEDKNMLVYRDKDKKVADYAKYIIDPVVIFPSNFRAGKPLTAEEQGMLTDLFRSQLLKELSGSYAIVETPGPDTARLRFAIRDMKPGNYYLDKSGAQKITPDMQLATASFEMEAVDSATGRRILALVRWLQNEDIQGADRQARLHTVTEVFADWVHALRVRLDQASIPK